MICLKSLMVRLQMVSLYRLVVLLQRLVGLLKGLVVRLLCGLLLLGLPLFRGGQEGKRLFAAALGGVRGSHVLALCGQYLHLPHLLLSYVVIIIL